MTRKEPLELNDLIWPDGTVKLADAGFPVVVDSNSRHVDEVRITLCQVPGNVVDYAFLVFGRGSGTGPQLVSIDYVDHISVIEPSYREMRLASGEEITYRASSGCGCGSRLAGYLPWGGTRQIGLERPEAPWTFSG